MKRVTALPHHFIVTCGLCIRCYRTAACWSEQLKSRETSCEK